MKRFACLLLVVGACGSSGFAQRRILDTPATQRQYAGLNDTTQLQLFNMVGVLDPRQPAGNAAMPGGKANGNTVSVSALQVPQAAMSEMVKFQEQYNAGKLEEGIKHLQKAIKIYPQWAVAHHDLGQCYARLRNYEGAATEFRNATALDVRLTESWVSLAELHFLQQEYVDGEEAARKALELEPENNNARYFLARNLLAEGHASAETVELLRASRDKFPAARLVLANVLLKDNHVDDAVAELRGYLAQSNAPAKEKVECMVKRLTSPAGTESCAIQ